MTGSDVRALMIRFEDNCAAFTRKDLDGYIDGIHPEAWTFQAGNFMPVSVLRDAAPAIFALSDRFAVTRWAGGVVVRDTGSVWGEFEYTTHDVDGGIASSTGSFSAHYTRIDGDWLILFTHYTPLTSATGNVTAEGDRLGK